MDREFLKRGGGLLRHGDQDPVSVYQVMVQLAEKASTDDGSGPGYGVARMARLLGVSRSDTTLAGFYDWRARATAEMSPRQRRRADLVAKIERFHAESDRTYRSPPILADLRDNGEQVSPKTVAKLMRSKGIVGISPRGWVPSTTTAS